MSRKKLPPKNFEWTSNLAYAVGLLVTDGCLSNDGRHIILRSSELKQIDNFKKCLGLTNIVGRVSPTKTTFTKKESYRVQFCNAQLYRWLLTIGLFPAKTYNLGAIGVPNDYFRDFLRGHLDGDGSVTVYQDTYNTKIKPEYVYTRFFVRFISASRIHIEWLRSSITKLIGVKGDLFHAQPRTARGVRMWVLKFMKKESMKLIPLLYYSPDVICLSRKRDKALAALEMLAAKKEK